MQYNIGDIVFVRNYSYKNGENGTNHFFVIIDKERAIEVNYFGLLISSNINKSSYPYNEVLEKDNENNLQKDSIVKCDDLIELKEQEISFKLGNVPEEQLIRFLNTFEKYLLTN